MENRERTEWFAPIALILIFGVLSLGIAATGYLYYRNYEKSYKAEVDRQLSAIADLKVAELVRWRKMRLRDSAIFHRNPVFSALVKRYLENPEDIESQEQIQTWLRHFQSSHQYVRFSLLDALGVERMSGPDKPKPVPPDLLQQILEILRSGQVSFWDLHREGEGLPIHLSVLVPILDGRDGNTAIGLLVLDIDPEQYLYPFISSWPTPSRTAETLLVRREGNAALFLNELKFQKNTALNLAIPLSSENTPAVKAVLGKEGIVEGKDYRGEPVIAAVRSVPGLSVVPGRPH